MRKILWVMVLVLVAAPAAAAEPLVEWGVYGGFDVGAMFLDLREFNDYLDTLRVMDFPGTIPLVGMQVSGVFGRRYHLGFEGKMFSQFQQGVAGDANLIGWLGGFVFGYDVIAHPVWRLRPEVGLGGAAVRLAIDGVETDFNDVEMPRGYREITYDKQFILGRFGLTAEWTPTFYRDGNGLLGLACSVTAGLQMPLSEDGWDVTAIADGRENRDVSAKGPDLNMLGGYLLFGVHFGGGIHTQP
jgi:hypothetical protein